MVGPLGVLPMGPASATTIVVEDIDGGPLGVLPAGLTTTTTVVVEDINGGPLGGLSAGPIAATTIVVEDVDGGPLGVLHGSDSGHRCSCIRRQWQHLSPFRGPDSICCLNMF
jgi:hypothetical protein